ncbi:MAG TPA: hypothetical protein DSN98_09010 [Thermoplasmata archaeon]|jgi:hypothetical protein|nr:MAG TPA: hypothetical protein DSN98_09010 [Thermoplasmata archaeon]
MTIDEKKEKVVECFRNAFDKEMAYRKVQLTPEEISLLDADVSFQTRLNYFLTEEREKLITKLRTFKDSLDEDLSYKATIELLKILYPEYIKEKKTAIDLNVKRDLSPEEEKRIVEEYGYLVGDKGAFKPKVGDNS